MKTITLIITFALATVGALGQSGEFKPTDRIVEALFSVDGEGLDIFPVALQRRLAVLAERKRLGLLAFKVLSLKTEADIKMLDAIRGVPDAFRVYVMLESSISGLYSDRWAEYNHDLYFGGKCGHAPYTGTGEATEGGLYQPYLPLLFAERPMLRGKPPTVAELANLQDMVENELSCKGHDEIRLLSQEGRLERIGRLRERVDRIEPEAASTNRLGPAGRRPRPCLVVCDVFCLYS